METRLFILTIGGIAMMTFYPNSSFPCEPLHEIEPQISEGAAGRAEWYEVTKEDYRQKIDKIIKKSVQKAKKGKDHQPYDKVKEEIQALQDKFNKKVEQAGNTDLFEEGAQRLVDTYRKGNLPLPVIDLRIEPLLQEGDKRGPGVYHLEGFEIQVVVTNLGNKKIALDIDPDKELPGGNVHMWRFEVEPLGKKGKKTTPFPYKIENIPSPKNGFVFLKPGEAFKRNLSLGKQYEIKSPGRYRVKLVYRYREDWPEYDLLNVPAGHFPSNSVEIELFR